MDKQAEAQQAAADSISSVGVTVKEYAASEGFDAPPAYQRPRATAVQVARIAAFTVVAVSFILGSFMLASAYITARASCAQYLPEAYVQQQELEEQPQYAHLVDPLQSDESRSEEAKTQEELAPPPPPGPASSDNPIQIKLPLQLDFDELAGSMMERNQRSRMNCVVEKRRAEEVMDHRPKSVRLPFGVNLTTDPRYEHITGERMAIFCESGHDQRHVPIEQPMSGPVFVPMMHQGPMHMMPVPFPMGPQMPHPMPQSMPHPMGPHHIPQPMPHQMPPHMPVPHHMPPQQLPQPQRMPQQNPHQHIPIPAQLLARIAEEHPAAAASGAIHIIAREEIVPMMDEQLPIEGRNMPHPVPSDTMGPPPPPPFKRMTTTHLLPQPNTVEQHQHMRPHFVQPRSVRSVDSVLHRREKRVRRCACDCAC